MRRAGGVAIGLIALVFGVPASAQSGPEGFYVTEIMETASGLELGANGRFHWMFTTGALDMTAEGRWRRDGNDVLLDTEPPVVAPRFEFVGAGREEAAALVVRVEDARGRTPQYLDVEAEYDAGERGYAHLEGGAYRFAPTPGRHIVAIRVGSGGFGFWSQRYPVPAEANQMRFRFFPGDLGRADFRGARASIEGETLTLTILGQPVRYRRLTAAENSELQTAIAEVGAATGAQGDTERSCVRPIVPAVAPGTTPEAIDVAIGAPFESALATSIEDYGSRIDLRFGAVRLRYQFGERTMDFGRIGGAPDLDVVVGIDAACRADFVVFTYQDRLLTLEEALGRAQGLETWLRAGGFELRPTTSDWPDLIPFLATAHARDSDAAFIASGALIQSADWSSAAQMLADPAIGVTTMHLFTLAAGGVQAIAYVDNVRQMAARERVAANPDPGDEREWLLRVTIQTDPAPIQEEQPTQAQ